MMEDTKYGRQQSMGVDLLLLLDSTPSCAHGKRCPLSFGNKTGVVCSEEYKPIWCKVSSYYNPISKYYHDHRLIM